MFRRKTCAWRSADIDLSLAVYSPSSCAPVLYVLGLYGASLTTDENGARLFAINSTDGSPQNSGVTIIQLAKVPLGIGTLNPSTGPAAPAAPSSRCAAAAWYPEPR